MHLCKVIKIMATFARNRNEMNLERDFAGFVLPFAAGIFLSTGTELIRFTYQPLACTASFAAVSAVVLVMLHPHGKRLRANSAWAFMVLLGLAAGIFSGSTACMTGLSAAPSRFGTWAAGFGHSLGDAIDGIPFENRQTNAVIKALVTGERNDIPRHVTDAFRDSGASHILALSGFHLGIVYAAVRWSLSWTGNSVKASRRRSVLIILLCGFYTLATGAGPSIVRAFLFILLGETAGMLHRRQTTAVLLMSSLLIQLALSPSSIRSVSFQLSYAAMSGIAYIYPWLRDFWPGNPQEDRAFTRSVRRIWNSAALSIACQLTTGPLAYLHFESFPKHFLLTNLIALPLAGLIIPSGLAVLVLHSFGICPIIMVKAAEALVQALSAALEIIAGM